MYSNSIGESVHSLLYNGFIEELVDILQLDDVDMLVSLSVHFDNRHFRNSLVFSWLQEIKSIALKTLTAVIHLDRNPK